MVVLTIVPQTVSIPREAEQCSGRGDKTNTPAVRAGGLHARGPLDQRLRYQKGECVVSCVFSISGSQRGHSTALSCLQESESDYQDVMVLKDPPTQSGGKGTSQSAPSSGSRTSQEAPGAWCDWNPAQVAARKGGKAAGKAGRAEVAAIREDGAQD